MFKRLIGSLAISIAGTAAGQSIERPTVKLGDECTYDIFDNLRKQADGKPEKIAELRRVVTAVDGERITSNRSVNVLTPRDTGDLLSGTEIFDLSLNTTLSGDRTFEPPRPLRFYPLAQGAERKDAKTKYPRLNRSGMTEATVTGKASDWFKLSTPAGEFNVITIVWDGGYSTSDGRNTWGGRAHYEISLSSSTWCEIQYVTEDFNARGSTVMDRTYRLTSFKPSAP